MRLVLALVACLIATPSAFAAKTKEAAQQCPYWETLQGSSCIPCPADQQEVVDGRDSCASNGGLGLSQQDEEDDDQQ